MTSLFADLPLPDQRRFDPHARLPALSDAGDTEDQGRDAVPTRPTAPSVPDEAALLEGLNPQQRQAVVHTGGELLIVAGAGSGKTRVLAHRIAYLLATGRARPGEILAITFTNKAAAEMRERVSELIGPRARTMWVSTFHSACVRILRREAKNVGLRATFSIYDAADAQRLMTLVCRELDLDPKRFPPKAFYRRVSDLKNDLIDPDEFAGSAAENPYEQNLAQAYARYQQRLREAHALDFDDLIMRTVTMLQTFPAIAEHYRRRFRHVLVDEYQDTNHAQYVLVRELVGVSQDLGGPGGTGGPGDAGRTEDAEQPASPIPPAELTVVGDADQSIYAFRGATIRNIVEFEKDYPHATTILLEQNYRSTQNILTAANAVIERNAGREKKNLWTDSGAGEAIVGYVADTEQDEATFVAGEVDRLIDSGEATAGDVAIFYRTNAQSRALEEVLVRRGLPYRVIGGTRFYERREVKDAVAYLRAVANPDDSVNLRRILNVPKRGLGERSEAMVAAHAEKNRISFGAALDQVDDVLGLGTRALSGLRAFNDMMAGFRQALSGGGSPGEVLDRILDDSGYLEVLRESSDPQDATRVENLAELHAVAAEFSAADPDADLGDFLERVALVADADQLPDEAGGVVTLMTVHTAKGLEYPIVFATGFEDGTFPHSRSLGNPEELAEERRLAYVALTRARERLYISRAGIRTAWGVPNELPASRFIADIPEEVLDWRRTESAMSTLRQSGAYQRGGRQGWGGSRESRGPGGSDGYGDYARRVAAPDRGTPSFDSAKPRGDAPDLEAGDRVTHDAYGLGRVVQVEKPGTRNAVAHVDFGDVGLKRLLLRFSPVTKL